MRVTQMSIDCVDMARELSLFNILLLFEKTIR